MAIADQLQALASDKSAIRNAILGKGGACPETHGFDNFAEDVDNIPYAFGTFSFDDFADTFEVTDLHFSPRKVFIMGADSRLHLHESKSVIGTVCLDLDEPIYKLMGQERTYDDINSFIWTSTYSTYMTVSSAGFKFENASYVFAKDTRYFWVAIG